MADATKTDMVAFRATEAERAKLLRLAEETHRTQSDVLRLLLAQAELRDLPDVRLKNPRLEVRNG